MSKDFSISIYQGLLELLIEAKFSFQTFCDFKDSPEPKTIMLRHDVDARKFHSLKFAEIQYELGISGTYYFRMVPQSFDENVIRKIAAMGHEIGYHYETMDKANGEVEKAYELFCRELEQLRSLVPIETICMHGSPLSKYDNRDLWKHYDYRELGITAEPYFDLDFSEVLYLTDTGRRWDGDKVSIRDKAPEKKLAVGQEQEGSESGIQNSPLSSIYSFHSTSDIIEACRQGNLPDKIMFNFHPQRWTNNKFLWTQEFVAQNIKNVVKRAIVGFQS